MSPNDVGWILRIGGVTSLLAFWTATQILDPETEDEY